MKHFLPSSVMLTPFVVRHYEEPEELEDKFEVHADKCDGDSETSPIIDKEPTEN